MTHPAPAFPQSLAYLPLGSTPARLALRLFVTLGCLGGIAPIAHAQVNELDVGVRPKITDKSNIYAGKTRSAPGTGGHSKIYGIVAVNEIKSDQRLVKPVDEKMILQVLSEEMNKNGFKLFAPGQKPDILITASYGRGELENPYIRDGGDTGGDYRAGAMLIALGDKGGVSNDSGATTSVITGAFAQQLIDEKTPGYQANLQKASYEKLYIRVTAWAYPTDPKARPKMLWKTIMVVDDPDHRDLNVVAAKMLEAGAPYFDKEIREPEAQVFKPLPDGHVNVGTPEVVAQKSK